MKPEPVIDTEGEVLTTGPPGKSHCRNSGPRQGGGGGVGKGPCREARVIVCGNTCQAARLLQTPPRGVASEGT